MAYPRPVPRRTTLKGNRQHWTRRLDKFRVRFDLSERNLKEVLGSVFGKSQMHDILSGKKKPRCEDLVKTIIAARLRLWLKNTRQLNALSIENEILAIFGESEQDENQEVESVLTQRCKLTPEAQKHFALSRDPFTGDPRSHKEVFTTPYFEKIVAHLEDAINYQHFVAVIGDIGAGKFILKRRIEKACDDSNGKMRLLWPKFPNMEAVHAGSICSFILREFEAKGSHDRVLRASRVEKLLESLANQGVRVALGFDECHRLDPRLLTALKNFYEMGGGFERYIGLILLGQPRFRNTLNMPEFREITERIDVIQLGFESKKQGNLGRFAWDYVAHRLKFAGGNAEKLFDRDVVTKLAKVANTPQALGNLCNAALNEAAEINQRKVHIGVLKSASRDGGPLAGMDNDVKVRAARAA